MNYVYIIECIDGSLYTGWTNHLEERYRAHCNGKGARYTKSHKPRKLLYYETYESKQDAMVGSIALKK